MSYCYFYWRSAFSILLQNVHEYLLARSSPTDILLVKGVLKRHTGKVGPRVYDPPSGTLHPGPKILSRDPGRGVFTWDLEPRTLTGDLIPGTHTRDPTCGTQFLEHIRGTNVRQLIFWSEFFVFCIVLFLMYNLEVS